MRIIILILLSNLAFGQSKVKTDCNTFFICIDSISYRQIFSNTFIKDTLFVCRENSTTTDNDSYSGKYAIGKAATIEFFKPSKTNKFGDNYGDWGIEFKTRKLGQLDTLLSMSEESKIKVDTSSTIVNMEGLKMLWYKSISIQNKNSELSILEYQKEYLNYIGFDDSKVNTEMTYEMFNYHLTNGKQYPRQFNKIKTITIDIDQNQLDSLQQFCFLNEMKQVKNTFVNDEFCIKYNLVKSISKMPVREIEIDLIDFQPQKTLKLTEKITLSYSGKNAKLVFVN